VIEVDVDGARTRIAIRGSRVSDARGVFELPVDLLVLDTGSAFDLIAPIYEIPWDKVPDWAPDRVHGFGGEERAQVFDAALTLENGDLHSVRVYAIATDRWVMGLPVLLSYQLRLVADPLGRRLLVNPHTPG
jgi:hypothetical protein